MNDDSLTGFASVVREGVTPSVVDMTGRSSYARVMVELKANVELKDNIVVAMPKITRDNHYTCIVRVEYEWKPPRCSSCKVFGLVYEECTKNTGAGEKKIVKKPSQTSRGVSVGPKIGFKPQKEYQPVTKKPNTSSSGNKKKGVEPNIKVSNSNPFDVLNSVDNDGEFGTNRGTNNLVNNKATSCGSSFINIDNKGECASNTPIGAKIDKIKRQNDEGKLRMLDNDGNPLVPTGIVESDSEVELVFDETANLRISTIGKDRSDKGYGTNSLLEQWRDSYPDNDDYDPYDDDMYDNHDLSEHMHSICDDIDITEWPEEQACMVNKGLDNKDNKKSEFKCDKRRCQSQDLVLDALDKRHIREDAIISCKDSCPDCSMVFGLRMLKEEDQVADNEETRWKKIHGDVFRFPKHKSLLALALGSGTHLLLLNLHDVEEDQVADNEETRWKKIHGDSNYCSSLEAIVILSLIWIFFASPLLLLGGFVGKNNASNFQSPYRTSKCPK
nr:hypothetical protein [Tanacetum cinerariifolium]